MDSSSCSGGRIRLTALLLVSLCAVAAAKVTPYQADISKDTIVDFNDFARFARDRADLNDDGVFDNADLGAFVSQWLNTWTPIRTVQDLNDIRNDLAGCYGLVNDVNASETSTWNEGKGFEPIGNDFNPFTGSLFGGGHSIIGLYINRPYDINVGLFGRADLGAILSDIRLKDTYTEGDTDVGTLVGTIKDAILSKIFSSGTVKLYNRGGGGIVGTIFKGTITDCFSECDVTGRSTIGGLIGGGSSSDPNALIITNCYSTGNVSGTKYIIGGLAGEVSYLIMTDCFSTSKVDGPSYVGGLVGRNKDNSSQIANSFFTDPNHQNGIGTYEEEGEEAFHGDSHEVYETWNFDANDGEWEAHPDALPTLKDHD